MYKNCPYFFSMFKSWYCDLSFLVFFVLLLLFLPAAILQGYSCIATDSLDSLQQIRKRILYPELHRQHVQRHILKMFIQLCTVGLPFCSATIGLAVISSIFPVFLLDYLYEYPYIIIGISFLIQLYSLYTMKCFKRVNCNT